MLLNDGSVDVLGEFGKVIFGRWTGGKHALECIALCEVLAALHKFRKAGRTNRHPSRQRP